MHPVVVITHAVAGQIISQEITANQDQIRRSITNMLPDEWNSLAHLGFMKSELEETGEAIRQWYDDSKNYHELMIHHG